MDLPVVCQVIHRQYEAAIVAVALSGHHTSQ